VPLSNKPQQTADYYLELIEDELLLFHPGRTTILYCNSIASLVWQLCNGQRTARDIVNLFQTAYPEAQETIAVEIEDALQQLAQHGAIEFSSR
jgi:hypothetical protein